MSKEDVKFIEDACAILSSVADDVLGQWAMMLTESATQDSFSQMSVEQLFEANLYLKGPHCLTLKVLAPREFATILHQNLIGDSEVNISDEELMDCMKEMTNVTAGKLISEICGETEVYDLSNITCTLCNITDMNASLQTAASIYLLGDDFPVHFLITEEHS